VGAGAAHVLVTDLRTLGDDVHHRHPVAASEAVVLGEPGEDRAGLGRRAEPALVRLVEQLPGVSPGPSMLRTMGAFRLDAVRPHAGARGGAVLGSVRAVGGLWWAGRMATRSGPWSSLPVRRVEAGDPKLDGERGGDWHRTVPAVRQVLEHGWDLGAATVLVGDNGAGKSTLVEGIATAFGMAPEGGSTGSMHRTRSTESGFAHDIRLVRGAGASKRGFFLRAETMHGFYTYLDEHPGGFDPEFHEMSHGESFLELIGSRMMRPGLYVLDEPESALSFTGSLALLQHLHDLVRSGSQVILSTHSPLLAALPGATVYEVGEWGLRECAWEDLDLVVAWRGFLDAPQRYLRHVLA